MNRHLKSSQNLVHLFRAFFTFYQLFYVSGVLSGTAIPPCMRKRTICDCNQTPKVASWEDQ